MPELNLLEMKGISKSFPGVLALDDVSFELKEGEVHVLMGENGAGKSTLMKILSGSYHADKGEIILKGEKVQFASPIQALHHGVAMIYQELNPVPHMTIAENIFLGKEPKLTKFGICDKRQMAKETSELLEQFGMEYLSPTQRMVELSVAETQMIEIIKAYSFKTRILIMDEPTSAITDHEVDKLFSIIKMLKKQGVGIVYISHKMDEVFQCGDRITVFRDGAYVATKNVDDVDRDEIIRLMIGRDLTNQFPKEEVSRSEVVLKVENLCDEAGHFKDVSFELYRGEILGIAGLMGAGRTEVVETIFGIRKRKSGNVYVDGEIVNAKNPQQAKKAGIALVTEDRKGTGLNLQASVRENISLCTLDQISKAGVLNLRAEGKEVDEQIAALAIKTPSRNQIVNFLSGGNQQKVVVSKWLLTKPEIFILDEPTRGIDVGAKSEMYGIMTDLVKAKKGIIMVSSELPEVLGMCDRVLVMHEGSLTGIVPREEFSQERIMHFATGTKREGK